MEYCVNLSTGGHMIVDDSYPIVLPPLHLIPAHTYLSVQDYQGVFYDFSIVETGEEKRIEMYIWD